MTPSQLEAAREDLRIACAVAERMAAGDTVHPDEARYVARTLLSATAPPSDVELSQEAAALRNAGAVKEATAMGWPPYRALYIAGARREGRK
jgi:hypothetical protein